MNGTPLKPTVTEHTNIIQSFSIVLRHDKIVGFFQDSRVSVEYIMDRARQDNRFYNHKTQKQETPTLEALILGANKKANKKRFQVFMPKKGMYKDTTFIRAIHGHTAAMTAPTTMG